MTVAEYARAQRAYRATLKRIKKNKPPRVGGYRKVPSTPMGSFGDIDYG
jgi:hypothetical protein